MGDTGLKRDEGLLGSAALSKPLVGGSSVISPGRVLMERAQEYTCRCPECDGDEFVVILRDIIMSLDNIIGLECSVCGVVVKRGELK
jgi:hypothetical protein